MEINSVVIIFLVWLLGAIVGRIIFNAVEYYRSPRRKVNKSLKRWIKDIEKMSDDEVNRVLEDYYDWKDRQMDDLK